MSLARSLERTVAMLVLLSAAPFALAQPQLTLQVEDREIYTDLPFTLALQARGFEATPEPEVPDLQIEGARVTYLGMNPNVSRQITIINGRRSELNDVTFVYRWRIQLSRTGAHQIPALTLTQGNLSAMTPPSQFTAKGIESTKDMIVRLQLPDRPVWVGETFEVQVEWLLAQDADNFNFVVPLFEMDQVRVEAPGSSERSVEFPTGAAGSVSLPMIRDDVNEKGTRYARFRFPARVTVSRPGPLDLTPIHVVAGLKSGSYRDRFGFRRSRTQLFKAVGERKRLVVRALPIADRPPGFVNAIGSGFSVSVAASRTVVQVGDPIELSILIRGDGELEGLSLPPLAGPGGLPPVLFSVPSEADVGVIDAPTNSKTYTATVRVRSAEVTEIPPLQFAYFNPVQGEYETVSSRPIALSVGGSNIIGVADVAVAAPVSPNIKKTVPSPSVPAARPLTALTGADMALSAPGRTLVTTWEPNELRTILILLYVTPMLVAMMLGWLVRTDGTRTHKRAIARASGAVDTAVKRDAPAREAGPEILAALRTLARACGLQQLRSDLITELENSAYDPNKSEQPIDPITREAVLALAADMRASTPREPSAAAVTASILAPLALTILLSGSNAVVAAGTATGDSAIDTARASYGAALDEPDRVRRIRLFGEAERQFRIIADAHPGAAALQADWGNAALGAQDIGYAVLAYRRALLLDPGDARAAKNLTWLRDRFPAWLPRPSSGGALDTLLFWERTFSMGERYLIGACAFAIAVLLAMPWPFTILHSRRNAIRRAALLVAAIWLAATASAWFGSEAQRSAVVIMDGSTLRSADSAGAPLAFANPLPAGTEVAIVEDRDNWVRIVLADGSRGWMTASAIERVTPGVLD